MARVVDEIREAGGEIYAITSEPQVLADRARDDWELPFECIGDPHHEIADRAREQGWLDIGTQEVDDFLTRATAWDVTHPKGFFQPGVLALETTGRVLYRWRSIPTRANGGGATGRPTPEYVWEQVERARGNERDGHAEFDEAPSLDGPPVRFPLFAALLMANGWFLRPRAFSYQGDGRNPLKRIPLVMLRLALFVALWVSAFVFLPSLWVSVALLLYLPIAVRGFRKVYSTFQTAAWVLIIPSGWPK